MFSLGSSRRSYIAWIKNSADKFHTVLIQSYEFFFVSYFVRSEEPNICDVHMAVDKSGQNLAKGLQMAVWMSHDIFAWSKDIANSSINNTWSIVYYDVSNS